METYKGVINKATGDLIRCGYTDFENDGSFDSATEEIKTDCPEPGAINGNEAGDPFDRWDGSDWVKV